MVAAAPGRPSYCVPVVVGYFVLHASGVFRLLRRWPAVQSAKRPRDTTAVHAQEILTSAPARPSARAA